MVTIKILKEIYLGVNPAIHSAEVLARLEELQASSWFWQARMPMEGFLLQRHL